MMIAAPTISAITPMLFMVAAARTPTRLMTLARMEMPRAHHSASALDRLLIPNHSATNGTMLQETAATETVWAMTIHQPDCQLTEGPKRRTKRDLAWLSMRLLIW